MTDTSVEAPAQPTTPGEKKGPLPMGFEPWMVAGAMGFGVGMVLGLRISKIFNKPQLPTRVPCADYFGVRDQALLAHATQIDPDGPWFAIPRELQADVWPTEDFELVRSEVATTTPEDDLFAGIDLAGGAA